jgi:hypothetical protein
MALLLILAQVALVVLQFLAHAVNLDLWVVFLPGILFGVLYLIFVAFIVAGKRLTFTIDTLTPFQYR